MARRSPPSEDDRPPTRAELEDRLARTRSRGQVKALGAEADADPALRAVLVAMAREAGIADADRLKGKTLVRRVLSREEAARVRENPIHRDEAFTCAWCGAAVTPGGRRVRDHCPRCLRSLHVDVVPGDRAADCGGILQPVALELEGGEVIVHHRCDRCGHEARVRAHPDDEVPPSLDPAELPARDAHAAGGRARTLPRRVVEAVRREGLWAPGDVVLVAASGGLDSTVLVELLWRTRAAHGATLAVASIDHGIRLTASQDVSHVLAHVRRLGVPFHTAKLEIAPGPELQARARAGRRAALRDIAAGVGATRIATAHHLDDQAETVLQRLAAGSGSTGLAAMRALDPPWCRPLLGEPREILAAWARQEGLAWREDPSNPASQRGRLRTLLAGLEAEVRAGATRGLARSARLLAREDAFLESLVDETPGLWADGALVLDVLVTLDPALQARALRRLAGEHARAAPTEQALRALADGALRDGWAVDLGAGRRLLAAGGLLQRA